MRNWISLTRMRNQEKTKLLLNGAGVDVANVQYWKQMLSASTATKMKHWNTLNYWVTDTVIQMIR